MEQVAGWKSRAGTGGTYHGTLLWCLCVVLVCARVWYVHVVCVCVVCGVCGVSVWCVWCVVCPCVCVCVWCVWCVHVVCVCGVCVCGVCVCVVFVVCVLCQLLDVIIMLTSRCSAVGGDVLGGCV